MKAPKLKAGTWTAIVPVPADAPSCPQPRNGRVIATYKYTDAEGQLLQLIMRLGGSDDSKKSFMPSTYVQYADGGMGWKSAALPAPRPLYNLHDLALRPDALVLIVEGEKCADAAKDAFPDAVVMTWPGGSNAVKSVDLPPLQGRKLFLLPDHDEPGTKAMDMFMQLSLDAGAEAVTLLDIERLALDAMNEAPQGCDIADILEHGFETGDFAAFAATYKKRVLPQLAAGSEIIRDPVRATIFETFGCEVNLPRGFDLSEDGLTRTIRNKFGDVETIFVSSPVYVIGRTRTTNGGAGWGHLVAYRDPAGEWHIVVIPSTMLTGTGVEMQNVLAHCGVMLGIGQIERQSLSQFIGYAPCSDIIDVAIRTGWHGASFVLPGRVISPEGAPRVLPPDTQGVAHFCAAAGDVEAWNDLAKAVGKTSRGAFAISAALCAPLTELVGEAGGGFHLYGRSSRGKTTMLIVAASVWGGGGRDGAVSSWSMTANGGEAKAMLHSGILLALDEIHLAEPDEIGDIIYRIVNGQGKSRARRDGGAASSAQWNATILSSGELTIEARLTSGRRGSARLTGGLAVRMVDIPHAVSDTATFEDIGDHADENSFARWMRDTALEHYGHAGPAFVKYLVNDRDGVRRTAKELINDFVDAATDHDDDPQIIRVARRFGLVAAAGTLATRQGILQWQDATAHRAALACFRAWVAARGTTTSQEEINIVDQVLKFLAAHGSSRFERIFRTGDDDAPRREHEMPVRDRCGYREDVDGTVVYYVLPSMWKSEICADLDPNHAAKLLRDRGVLQPGEGTRLQKKVRLPENPKGARVYALRPDLMEDPA
jgi:uncharacterized protein (DUF927 family)